MKRLRSYINRHYFSTFLSFFLPLFGIASLIFFVKIVSVTSIVHITFLELFQLYIFILPQILFFTLSITFFVSAVTAIYKLSYEFELIALFALGISPNAIIKIFFRQALLLSTLLLIFGLVLVPQAKQLYKGFILYKKAQMHLNIKPSEFGHRFGSWYLYIESKEGDIMQNVALFNHDRKKENLILAQKSRVDNNQSGIRLTLLDGTAYGYSDEKLQQMRFSKMQISDSGKVRDFHYVNVISYWEKALRSDKRAFDMTFFIFIALFPLVSIFYIGYLGITNTRYERRNVFLSSLAVTVLYFALAFGLAKPLGFKALALLPLWMAAGYWLYRKKILARY